MCTLYIIQGFLGAGKTTYSRKLAQQTEAVRLNADEWCVENYASEQLANDWQACHAEAIRILWEKAEQLLKDKRDVILDFGFWNKTSRDYARRKASDLHVRCRHYYITAPDAVLLERLRHRSGNIAQENLKNFHALKSRFEEPEKDENAVSIQ